MSINVYVQKTKLTNVAGRIEYAASPESQHEKLIAVAGEQNIEFWQQLGRACRRATKNGECIEGIELMAVLPDIILEKTPLEQQQYLQSLVDTIEDMTGCKCLVALHDSHADKSDRDEGNAHVHIIIAEREQEYVRINADKRAVFLDEAGNRVRTKKEVLREDGELREGCVIVPKGETYDFIKFSSKNAELSTDRWLRMAKQELADWINQSLEPDKVRVVYNKYTSEYLAQIHIKKGTPAEQAEKMRTANQIIKQYNKLIDDGIISKEDAFEYKQHIFSSPDRAAEVVKILDVMGIEHPPYEPWRDQNKDESREKLRALHRESSLAWAEYRALKESGADALTKADALNKARSYSIAIERQRKAMGLMTLEEYKRIAEKAKKEEKFYFMQLRRVYKSTGRSLKFAGYSINNAFNKIGYLQYQIREEKKKLFPDKHLLAMLQSDLDQAREELDAAYERKYELKAELKEKKLKAKADFRAAREKAKQDKRDYRQKKQEQVR